MDVPVEYQETVNLNHASVMDSDQSTKIKMIDLYNI